jgi:nicotinamidase-related amidase
MSKALLIVDIQNDYFRNGKMELVGADKAGENAKIILEKFRDKNLTVVHIQHIAINPSATFFLPDTEGVKINSKAAPEKNEKIIIKHYPNSFRETGLLDYLKSKEVSNLVICGMMTHMCIDTTARAAYDAGFNCIVIGDACATKDLEFNGEKATAKEVQVAYLSALHGTFADVQQTAVFVC